MSPDVRDGFGEWVVEEQATTARTEIMNKADRRVDTDYLHDFIGRVQRSP